MKRALWITLIALALLALAAVGWVARLFERRPGPAPAPRTFPPRRPAPDRSSLKVAIGR
jgi:hypothetical protein